MNKMKLRWDKVDSILLFLLVASIITLICTCTLVWNPYLLTSTFYWGNCLVRAIDTSGFQQCSGQNTDQCYTPTVTIPPQWSNVTGLSYRTTPTSKITTPTLTTTTPTSTTTKSSSTTTTISQNSPLFSSMTSSPTTTTQLPSSSSITSSIPAGASSTTLGSTGASSASPPATGRRRRRRDTGDECVGFPCAQVIVLFNNPDIGPTYRGMIWDHYSDMINYPQCSVSSCDTDDTDNMQNVQTFLSEMYGYAEQGQFFTCYINANNFSQVLYQLNGSYSAAINSIIWPIIALIVFFFLFVAHLFRYGLRGVHQPPPPSYDASFGAGVQGSGQVQFVEVGLGASAVVNNYALGGSMDGTVEKDPGTLGAEATWSQTPGAAGVTCAQVVPPPQQNPEIFTQTHEDYNMERY